jgi:hypothetical protein
MQALITDWTVAVRHGNGWRVYPMPVPAKSDLAAAKDIRRSWGRYKIIRVRPTDMPAEKWRRFRFI